jgi:hypothetical protein
VVWSRVGQGVGAIHLHTCIYRRDHSPHSICPVPPNDGRSCSTLTYIYIYIYIYYIRPRRHSLLPFPYKEKSAHPCQRRPAPSAPFTSRIVRSTPGGSAVFVLKVLVVSRLTAVDRTPTARRRSFFFVRCVCVFVCWVVGGWGCLSVKMDVWEETKRQLYRSVCVKYNWGGEGTEKTIV